jgi:hypothetical protein
VATVTSQHWGLNSIKTELPCVSRKSYYQRTDKSLSEIRIAEKAVSYFHPHPVRLSHDLAYGILPHIKVSTVPISRSLRPILSLLDPIQDAVPNPSWQQVATGDSKQLACTVLLNYLQEIRKSLRLRAVLNNAPRGLAHCHTLTSGQCCNCCKTYQVGPTEVQSGIYI